MVDLAAAVIAAENPTVNQSLTGAILGGIGSLLPWLIVAALIFWCRGELKSFFASLAWRMKVGASVKFGSVEIGSLPAIRTSDVTPQEKEIGVFVDPDHSRQAERDAIYKSCRGVMLVHKIFKSAEDGQLFDIHIFVIPHKEGSLNGVREVQYFLGHYWGNKVFPSSNRYNGFAISTSAYGPMLCTAKIIFTDGISFTQARYIDFEMGATAPALLP